jgi:hypothetical protein
MSSRCCSFFTFVSHNLYIKKSIFSCHRPCSAIYSPCFLTSLGGIVVKYSSTWITWWSDLKLQHISNIALTSSVSWQLEINVTKSMWYSICQSPGFGALVKCTAGYFVLIHHTRNTNRHSWPLLRWSLMETPWSKTFS